jgi:hypothetical protein
MPSVKSITRAARRLVGAESLSEKLERRRLDALASWRKCVAAHAEGREVDLDELATAASIVGIGSQMVASTLESDARLWREHADLERNAQASRAHADSLKPSSDAARARVVELREELRDCEIACAADSWAAVSAAHSEGAAMQARRQSPRLWDDALEIDARAAVAAIAVEDRDPDQPQRRTADQIPPGSADWIDDDAD